MNYSKESSDENSDDDEPHTHQESRPDRKDEVLLEGREASVDDSGGSTENHVKDVVLSNHDPDTKLEVSLYMAIML